MSLGGLAGTSSLLGGEGADSITVGGSNTQWLIDAGADADSLYITNAAERTSVEGGAGDDGINIGVVSKGLVWLRQVMTPSKSLVLVLPVHL